MHKYAVASKSKNNGELGPARRRLVRLGACVCIIAATVAVKNTGNSAALEEIYLRISRDVDYAAAFATAGEALSGGEGVARAVSGLYDDIFITRTNSSYIRETVRIQELYQASQKEFSKLDVPANVNDGYVGLGFSTCLPAEGVVTDGFGYRIHPVTGEIAYHYGVDIAGEEGDRIRAFAEGEVTAVGESSIDGLFVKVTHADGTRSMYAHCSQVLVQKGDRVSEGDTVALMGSTGNATGPCLHFEIVQGDTYINPTYYIGELV